MPFGIVEAATPVLRGSPPLTRSPVSTCCTHYPGGPVQVHLSAASPNRAAFPVLRAGRRPRLPFRGLLRLHTRYGPSIRSPAQGEVCRRASIRPVTQPHRLPATGPTDHCPGGTCTHKVIAPFGAHRRTTEPTRRSTAFMAQIEDTRLVVPHCRYLTDAADGRQFWVRDHGTPGNGVLVPSPWTPWSSGLLVSWICAIKAWADVVAPRRPWRGEPVASLDLKSPSRSKAPPLHSS